MQAVMNLALALAMVGAASNELRDMRHKMNNIEHAKNLAVHAFQRLKEKHA